MSDKVFFSYSRSDSVFVLKLASDLRNAGANIWLDQLDIPPGSHWDSEIEEALNSSNCLLAILSPKSMESNNAMDEISYALEENKKVIPVLLTNTETPFRLRRLQRVDFTGDYEHGFRQLLRALHLENIDAHKVITASASDTEAKKNSQQTPLSQQQALQEKEAEIWSQACALHTRQGYMNYIAHSTLRTHISEATTFLNHLDVLVTKQLMERKAQVAGNKKKYLFAIAGSIAFVALTWAAFHFINRETATLKSNSINESPNTENSRELVPIADTPGITAEPPGIKEEAIVSTQSAGKTPAEKPAIKLNQPAAKKEPPVKTTIVENTIIEKPVEKVQPEPTPVTPKEININYRVVVPLTLLQLPDMNQRKKTEQPVKFTTTKAIYFSGVLIIRQGAIAHGTLTIGRKGTDIKITQVEGANGKIIPLTSQDDHGSRDDVRLNKEFIAIIKQGTRMGF